MAVLFAAAFSPRAATFTPTSTNDFPVTGAGISVNTASGVISGGAGNGLITLRSAVIAANANSNSTINIPAGVYTLTIAGDDGNVDPNPAIGDLDVLTSVTIKGAGPGNTIIQAGTNPTNGIDQIFTLNAYYTSTGKSAVVNGFTSRVSDITFRFGKCVNLNTQSGSFVGAGISFDAGYDNGNPIASPGSMVVSNCVFDSNSSTYGGGAIATFDGGTVTIDSCTFTNNGIGATGNTASGGAIVIGNTTVNNGVTTIKNSTFVKNVATGAGGAMLFFGGNPTCFVHNCLVANNVAAGEGGGIYGTGLLTIDQGTIISNNISAGTNNNDAQGGGLYLVAGPTVSNCTIVSNTASLTSTDQRGGGGIAVGGGNVTISNCRIFGNVAASGSGVHKDLNTGILNAINNWWGANGGPGATGNDSAVLGGGGSGGGAVLNVNPWLVMSFSASPTTILTGGTSTLTASITKNSASAAGFTVPNATPVNFGGTLGTDSPASTTLTSGTGTSTFTAGSTGGAGGGSATIDNQTLGVGITINQPPLITSANNTTFVVGGSGTFTVTKTGLPTPGLNVSGALPSGVNFAAGTGILSGMPAAGTGGIYPLTITATNAAGTNVQSFTLTVNQAAAITSPGGKTFIAGSASNFTVTASGFPAPTFTENGTLPGGVAFTNSTGILGGTPAFGTGGIYPITLTAHNGVGSDATQSFTLTVNDAPLVNCPPSVLTNAAGGVCLLPSIPFAATATGFPAPGITYKLGAVPVTSPVIFPLGTNIVTCAASNAVGTNTCSFTVTVQSGPAPRLSIVPAGTDAVVSWTNSYGCYTLQVASLLASNTWRAYPGPFTTNGGFIFVTNHSSPSNAFFRLSH